MKKLLLLIAFNASLTADETVTQQVISSDNSTPPNVHVRFINNNRHTIVQSFSGPGHHIEIATRVNPGKRIENNRQNATQPNIIIKQENEGSGPCMPPAPHSSATEITNHNDMIIVQANANQEKPSEYQQAPEPMATQPLEPNGPMAKISAATFSLLSWLPLGSPVKTLLACSALGYTALLIKLLSNQHSIENSKTWSCWKEDLSIAILRKNEQMTAQQLFADMQKQYGKPTEKNNFFAPILSFMQSTEQELTFLQQYIKICDWISTYKLTALLPNQKETVTKAKSKIERLEYIRQLIVIFASEYKVE